MKAFFIILLFAACATPGAKKPAKPDTPVATQTDPLAALEGPMKSDQLSLEDVFSHMDMLSPGLKKIIAMIDTIHATQSTPYGRAALSALDDKTYAALSFHEQFVYNMLHCEELGGREVPTPDNIDPEHRIYAFLDYPPSQEYATWSPPQDSFFINNRDSVIVLFKDIISRQNQVNPLIQTCIWDIDATDMVPLLIDTYRRQPGPKDHYILTLLMLLMRGKNFPEFMHSSANRKLYGEDVDEFTAHLVYNRINEERIIAMAMDFYNAKSH